MYRQQNGNKYHAERAEYAGILFHSKIEAAYAAELDLRKKAGQIVGWERQVRIPLMVNGQSVGNYYIDFLVTEHDGTKTYVEVKGFETTVWRLKFNIVEAMFKDDPEKTLLVVKQSSRRPTSRWGKRDVDAARRRVGRW